MLKRIFKKTSIFLIAVVILNIFLVHGFTALADSNDELFETARPSVNGKLHVDGRFLVDENGKSVLLRGVSTHGLTWYPDFIDEGLFEQLSTSWNCSFIRLAMYSETYCGPDKEENLALMKKGIDAAIAADMYVLVDWHILKDNNPNINKKEAEEFFDKISSEYADCPNIIYEICNEPNGTTSWNDIVAYADDVIPIIRKNNNDALIIVGTPEYDRRLLPAVRRPLKHDNVMYAFHFYAGTHKEDLRSELETAINENLPVFVTECGISEESGDGDVNFASARDWFNYVYEKNISYAVWSFSNKDEASAFFILAFDPKMGLLDKYLSESGKWVKELIRGVAPDKIPAPADIVHKSALSKFESYINFSLGKRGYDAISSYLIFAPICFVVTMVTLSIRQFHIRISRKKYPTYYEVFSKKELKRISKKSGLHYIIAKTIIVLSSFFTLIYLCWRVFYSIPFQYGIVAVIGNIILLIVEILGFIESLVLYEGLLGMKNHPLPEIGDDEYPDVDIFIATYNEPCELLKKTINGCNHLIYPDKSKVHIYVCDDNRRPQMRELAKSMGVGYFDRPDNKGAKAGNLNNALRQTSSPYIVTLDADMIVKSDFLLKTIPYFVDVENHNKNAASGREIHLGVLQTPQCFYDPDVFQHALYSERRAPNEQDFFYRTIEVGKTSSNSVIYGGSNTVLSRRALEDIGGFYTESITEDFATGLLIESAGYVSMAIPEPLASGQTPHTYKEHIQQRTRWGRGVIVTAKKLKIWRRKGLSMRQKVSYWSSVSYWYSPIKNFVYMLAPILFATFAVPVLYCNWLELFVFWLPMFLAQDLALRVFSKNAISLKWSGIYETSVMPHLLIPIIKESLGISLKTFKVTDKSGKAVRKKADIKMMMPFIILITLSVIGIIRVIAIIDIYSFIGLIILLFWMVRNIYFLIMALFLIDGRESTDEDVCVIDAEPVCIEVRHGQDKGNKYEGVTTRLTEHSIMVYLDDGAKLTSGAPVNIQIIADNHSVNLKGAVTSILESKNGGTYSHTVEILDFGDDELEYWEILYDRVPSLPQSLSRDFGILIHLWQNIAHRVARTIRN